MEAALGGGEAGGELLWLDPRAARTDAAARARAAKQAPPTDAVVFVVGGGNYIEYHNLIDFAKVIFLVDSQYWLLSPSSFCLLCYIAEQWPSPLVLGRANLAISSWSVRTPYSGNWHAVDVINIFGVV